MQEQFWWHITFNSNLLFTLKPFTNITAHLWTLSVEEQFYLLWPAVILLAPQRHLRTILIAAIAIAPLYRAAAIFVFASYENAPWIITIGCFDSLGVGALLALLEGNKRNQARLLTIGFWSLPAPILLALFGDQLFGGPWSKNVYSIGSTFSAFAFAWIIFSSVSRPIALLRSPVLTSIGVVSYGAYVFHLAAIQSVIHLYQNAFGQLLERGALLFALATMMTLSMAVVSWKLFEQPINSLKYRWPYAGERRLASNAGH